MAVSQLKLDNEKASMSYYAMDEGAEDMARKNYCVTLPNGLKVWPSGNTVSDAFQNFAENYGHMYTGSQPKKKAPLLIEYAEKWFELYHKPKVKSTTARNTRIILEKHIYPELGRMFMDEIAFDDVQRLFSSTMHLSESTHDKIKIYLGKLFRNAVEDGLIEKNIMATDRYVLSKKKERREPLTYTETSDIIRNMENLKADDRMYLALLLYTGLRRSEVLGLRWNDVDYDKGVLYISRAATFDSNTPILDDTKTEAGKRMLPLLKPLREMLESYPRKGEYILGGEKLWSQQKVKRMWERIEKVIDVHGATPHVLRHTFATLAEPHLDVKTLQSVMGHSDIQTTMNRYTHPQERNIIQAVSTLSDVFSA